VAGEGKGERKERGGGLMTCGWGEAEKRALIMGSRACGLV
jgi:hypothetical protein